MKEGMSVMLRFGRRVPELEEAFKKDGHRIAIPREKRKELDKFNVAVTSSATFADAIENIERFLSKYSEDLRAYADAGRGPVLDIGIELDNPTFFMKGCCCPRGFLRLLVSLDIELWVSLYT